MIFYCGSLLLSGQATPEDSVGRIRTAMNASIEKQRVSVRLQVQSAQPDPGGFFTVPWPSSAPPAAGPADCDPLSTAELTPMVDIAAAKYGVQAKLVRAVIAKESGGRPCAVSVRGAQGLMQIMPVTAAELKLENPFDPQQNVEAGTHFLKTLLDRFSGDLKLALGAYNAGAGTVDKQGGVPTNAETQDYVTQILKALTEPPAGLGSPPGSAETSAKTKAP
jgi:soluble lytic murein transglycosylase-like protein